MEVESVSSTGATEYKGDISFKMGDDGKLIYGPDGNGEPDGIFKFSSKEIAGETGAEGHEDDPKYRNYLNYHIVDGNQNEKNAYHSRKKFFCRRKIKYQRLAWT